MSGENDAQIKAVEKGLNAARTFDDVRLAIGEALTNLGAAYKLRGITASGVKDLDNARVPLEKWFGQIKSLRGDIPPLDFQAKRPFITRAYVNIAGVNGVIDARKTVSLFHELAVAAAEAPKRVAGAIGEVAAGAANVAGDTAFALIKPLLPVLVILIVVLFVVNAASKRAA